MKFVDTERRSERPEEAKKELPVAGVPTRAIVALACLYLFSFSGLCASQVAETFPEVATIPVEEIHAGMLGYGLSVFKGTTPERFEVEVLGVLANQKPSGSYILARLSGQNLEKSGVIAGMSGSPVYLDGRLAGAVAFSWPFASEPIAGITPIAAMRGIRAGSFGRAGLSSAAQRSDTVELGELASRDIPAGRLDRELESFARSVSNEGRSALLWGATGFGPGSRALLARLLPASAAALSALGGGQRADIESDLGPGTSVAALFVDGDLRLAATGTVTDRIGDELLAFGHSAVGVSEFSMPLATSEVITVMPSALSSFKLANSGAVVGSFERDHPFGAVGHIGSPARTVPLIIEVRAPTARRFDLQLADMPQFLPALTAIGCLGAWDVAAGTGGVRSVDLGLRVELAGKPDREALVLEQSFEGTGAAQDAVGFVISVLSYLVQNDFGPLELSRIGVDVRLSAEPRAATLTYVRPSRTRVAPGETVDLQIDALGWRGEAYRWTERVVVPSGLPDGRYSFLVGDGGSADAARLALAPAPPTRIEQALAFLRSLHSSSDLVIMGVLPGAGLSTGGEVLPRLPGSLRSIWGGIGGKNAKVVRNAIEQTEAHRRDRPLAGLVRVDVEIRRRLDRVSPSEGRPGPGGERK